MITPPELRDATLDALAYAMAGDLAQVVASLEKIATATANPDSAFYAACCGWAVVATHGWDGPGYVLQASKTDTGKVIDAREGDDGSGVIQAMQFLVARVNGDSDMALAIFNALTEAQVPGFLYTVLNLAADAANRLPEPGATA